MTHRIIGEKKVFVVPPRKQHEPSNYVEANKNVMDTIQKRKQQQVTLKQQSNRFKGESNSIGILWSNNKMRKQIPGNFQEFSTSLSRVCIYIHIQ
jgi:hypothetical protein